MADADIQESDRIVRAWEATAKPGDLPPLHVHAHALKLHEHLRAHGADNSQPQLSAVDRFKRMPRSDAPQQHPAWDGTLVGNSVPHSERAADKFRRQRLARGT